MYGGFVEFRYDVTAITWPRLKVLACKVINVMSNTLLRFHKTEPGLIYLDKFSVINENPIFLCKYDHSQFFHFSDPDILNEINWSKKMEEAFLENRNQYPNIYWQSFGSQKGVLRIFPLARWETVDGLPDLFDVRRRPWYIHGTSSPKDVVILLDK